MIDKLIKSGPTLFDRYIESITTIYRKSTATRGAGATDWPYALAGMCSPAGQTDGQMDRALTFAE